MEKENSKQSKNASSTKHQAIDSLPVELLTVIMKLLDLNSLLKCRMVSRKWTQLVDAIKIRSLSVVTRNPDREYDHSDTGNYWHINESINYKSTLFTAKSIRFLEKEFMRVILSRIKRLFISYVVDDEETWTIFESFLSRLTELDQLQIRKLRLKNERTISLPSVTILSVYLDDRSVKLFANAPKLSKIKWSKNLANLELSNPSNITHLDTEYHSNSTAKFESFKNCEFLYLSRNDFDLSHLRNLISQVMFKLKEVHWCWLERKNQVIDQLKTVKGLNRPNLKLFIQDYLVSNENDVDNLCSYRIYPYGGHYYEKLADVVTKIYDLNYSRMIVKFGDSLPLDFNSKFVAVREVSIDQLVNNKADLVNLIRNCKLLWRLIIHNSSVDQSFYDDLPRYSPYIGYLEIEEPIVSLDSSFIVDLQYLKEYKINQNVPYDLIRSVFYNSSKFESISYMLKNKRIGFSSDKKGSLRISNCCSIGLQSDDTAAQK